MQVLRIWSGQKEWCKYAPEMDVQFEAYLSEWGVSQTFSHINMCLGLQWEPADGVLF